MKPRHKRMAAIAVGLVALGGAAALAIEVFLLLKRKRETKT